MHVNIFQTPDDGDINIEDGLIEFSGGLSSMAYLCLFGGNEDDSGSSDNRFQWWGNIGEKEEDKYKSNTQFLLQSLPPTSGNLLKLQAAAEQDLDCFLQKKIASSISVLATIPKLNTVRLEVNIDGKEVLFVENWGHDNNETN